MIVTKSTFDFSPSFADIIERREICRKEGYDESLAGEACNWFEASGNKHSSFCFLCGSKLTIPCVVWVGVDEVGSGEIWFHIECAKEFGSKLLEENAKYP